MVKLIFTSSRAIAIFFYLLCDDDELINSAKIIQCINAIAKYSQYKPTIHTNAAFWACHSARLQSQKSRPIVNVSTEAPYEITAGLVNRILNLPCALEMVVSVQEREYFRSPH